MSRTKRAVPYWAKESLREEKAELMDNLKRIKKYRSRYYNCDPYRGIKYYSAIVRGQDGKTERVIADADYYNTNGYNGYREIWGQSLKKSAKKYASKNRRLHAKRLIQQELDEL